MRTLLSILFVFYSCASIGQTTKQTNVQSYPPAIFLDSVRINFNHYFFDPQKIADIKVKNTDSDSTQKIQGKIYIVSKNPKDYKFISLDDVIELYKDSLSHIGDPIIFMVNNEFLKDKSSSYQIDYSYILKVEVLKGGDFYNLKENLSNLTIIKIKTRTPENLKEANQIIIRGVDMGARK